MLHFADPNWGRFSFGGLVEDDSDLESYLASVRHNLGAPIEALPPVVRIADRMLLRFNGYLERAEGAPSLTMFLYSRSAWRQALVVIQAGGTYHAPPILRTALEAAFYGYLFKRAPEMYEAWQQREENKTAASKFRNGWAKRARSLLEDEKPSLREYLGRLEDDLITLGAHPNFLGVNPGLDIELPQGAEAGKMSFRSLSNDSDRLAAWWLAAQVAHVVGLLYALMYPKRAQLGLMEDVLDDLGRALLIHSEEVARAFPLTDTE